MVVKMNENNLSCKYKHLIIDSGGFIKNANLKDLAENNYVIREVITEIKDKATRARLQVLPYDLIFKNPLPESIKKVTDFSKKTGDFASLSAVDLRVIALAYELEQQHVGIDHIRTEPLKLIKWNPDPSNTDTILPGFFLKQSKKKTLANTNDAQIGNLDDSKVVKKLKNIGFIETTLNHTTPFIENSDIVEAGENNNSNKLDNDSNKNNEETPDSEKDYMTESEDESSDEDTNEINDDDDNWITPGNIKQKFELCKEAINSVESTQIEVSCLTTDFAIQNVLIQMGLKVTSVDGMLIKRAKSYVLRCFGCYKIAKDMTRHFCHHCGNKTLQKVSMSVNEDGSIAYHLSNRKKISTRGMRYSLPLPKGGKYSTNPILCEDQTIAQQRISKKAKAKLDVFDPDYVALESPFKYNDITSKSSLLGFNQKRYTTDPFFSKRNPNENRKNYGRRK